MPLSYFETVLMSLNWFLIESNEHEQLIKAFWENRLLIDLNVYTTKEAKTPLLYAVTVVPVIIECEIVIKIDSLQIGLIKSNFPLFE